MDSQIHGCTDIQIYTLTDRYINRQMDGCKMIIRSNLRAKNDDMQEGRDKNKDREWDRDGVVGCTLWLEGHI